VHLPLLVYKTNASSYHWHTLSSTTVTPLHSLTPLIPAATWEAASQRISRLYENIIFDDADEEVGAAAEAAVQDDESISGRDQTTIITWPPTAEDDLSKSRLMNPSTPVFSLSNPSQLSQDNPHSFIDTQDTQEETGSFNYSDASSITRFPAFKFTLHSITSLSSLAALPTKGTKKVSVLLAVLEVEGPDCIRIKKGVDAGKEVSILKMILGDEVGQVCKLTAWREVADAWGGGSGTCAVKRGDIVFIENVTATYDPTTSTTLSASPYLKSNIEICYRTMPYTHDDNRLRPDLRLGISDAAVRKVAAIVKWFEGMAGLSS